MKKIIVSGNIGVGKSTLCENLYNTYNIKFVSEKYEYNKYLDYMYNEFKENKKNTKKYNKYCFLCQQEFLNITYDNIIQNDLINKNENLLLYDRYIYDNYHIFTKSFFYNNNITNDEYEKLTKLYDNYINHIQKPNLIIYLYASIDTNISRIYERNRLMEDEIDIEYIENINKYYEIFINDNIYDINIIKINTNKYNKSMLTKYVYDTILSVI